MYKKQTSVSHSCTESEVMSLDAGLRMDGLSALDLWDMVIEVLHSFKNTESPIQEAQRNLSRNSNTKPKRKRNRDVDELSNVDYVDTNASSFSLRSHAYICEDKANLSCTSLKTMKW